jgi:tripartite-type tricarboxylate transporter receptor subunit TctC
MAATLALGTASAAAQSAFPDRPLRIVVGFAGGGFGDITTRLFAERLSPLVGQSVVVENIAGAGGVVAAQSVLKSKPDGHTLFLLVNGHAAAKAVFKSLAFDPVKDFAPIGLLAYFDLLIVAKGEGGQYRTLAELIGVARANPGKLNIGTVNPGSTQNLAAELFKANANVNLSVVPYKGTPDLAVAVLGDQLDALVDTYTALKSQIDAGRLRALASSGPQRSASLPNVPTVKESGLPDYEVVGWNSLAVPVGTPPAVIATLNRHLNTVVSAPDFKKRLLDLGAEPGGGAPEDLGRRVAGDVAKWEAIITKAGLPRL